MSKDGTMRGGARTGAGRRKNGANSGCLRGRSGSVGANVPPIVERLFAELTDVSGSSEKTLSESVDHTKNAASSVKKNNNSTKKTAKSTQKRAKDPRSDEVKAVLKGVDTPDVDNFFQAVQACGKPLRADMVFSETRAWLSEMGCESAVSRQLIEQYAMSVARWIQAEQMISEYGFLSEHPTTGAPIASPYVAIAQNYSKQVSQAWYQIYQIVRESLDAAPRDSDDPMEKLLRGIEADK